MIRIITDSISDLSQQEGQAQDFRVLPLTVRFGSEEFRDGIDLDHDAFYARLVSATELPKTSQITPEAFDRAFCEELRDPTNEVLCITGSSKLSGTWQSAMMAREMSNTPERIHIVDSLNVSLGEATLVRLALVHRAEMPNAAALKDCLEDYVRRSCLIGKAEVLKYLVMGGRLSVLGGAVGSALHIKPLLRLVEGKLTQAGICRSKHRALEWFAQQLQDVPPGPRRSPYHCSRPCPGIRRGAAHVPFPGYSDPAAHSGNGDRHGCGHPRRARHYRPELDCPRLKAMTNQADCDTAFFLRKGPRRGEGCGQSPWLRQ